MRVSIVNQYYPPDTSATAGVFRDVAEALAEAGHEVTVLSGRPSYDPEAGHPWRPLSRGGISGVSVERVGSTALDRRRTAGRAANYLSYLSLAAIRGLLSPRPDVVIAGTDPPLAVWAGLLTARGRPVVYNLQDLHPDIGLATGWIRPGRAVRIWDYVHTSALRSCSMVVCLGQDMADRVMGKGVYAQRLRVIAHGGSPANNGVFPEVVSEVRGGSEFLALHAGNIGWAGPWETIVEADRLLGDLRPFAFVGDGTWASQLRRAGLRVLPFRSPEEIPSVMAAGDLQMVCMRQGMEGLLVPSKLYGILAHGRPVLAVAPSRSHVARVVERYRCGIVADPADPADVAEKVRWGRANPRALETMSKRALRAGSRFDRAKSIAQFVDLVENVGRQGRR